MAETIIPPWVRPESPETIRTIDDATSAFPPAFGRGQTQRGIWADPRWGLRRRYRGLRSDEKAAILNALNETRGQLNILRVTPHTPIRGSFATSELLSNNTFASSTTGWTQDGFFSLAVSDRALRLTRTVSGGANCLAPTAAATVVQYAPYAVRAMLLAGRGGGSMAVTLGSSQYTNDYGTSGTIGFRLATALGITTSTTAWFGVEELSVPGMAGEYFAIPYVSLARCALVDNGPNAFLQSDTLGTTWTATNVSVSSNTSTAPDGTASVADSIMENGSAGSHLISQTGTKAAQAEDWCAYGYFARGNGSRDVRLGIGVNGSNLSSCIFDLGAGTAGSATNSGTNTNGRAFIAPAGNGYYFCCVVARLASTATTYAEAVMVNAGSVSYTGNSTSSIIGWRVGGAASSFPTRGAQTTTTALASGAVQSGSGIYTKGWPVSTSGLLLTGDWVEINGELKQLTAPVNSDAAGLAYMQFRPGLAGSPADNDPIIVFEPFGRFIYPGGTREFENMFGIYGDCEMNLEEIYS